MTVQHMNDKASQSEIWLFDPDPIKGNELGKKIRPCFIISNDFMNHGPSELIIVIPITSVDRGIPSHIPINPPDGGVTLRSYALCEQIRSISKLRLIQKLGKVKSKETIYAIRQWVLDLTNFEN